ncbi:MAG: hypothetical protein LBQ60_13800 [Bacteroidales bacterium]|jgi:hypothetical protein|nr:hypothetical protein [Bacteroidales bacterium]
MTAKSTNKISQKYGAGYRIIGLDFGFYGRKKQVRTPASEPDIFMSVTSLQRRLSEPGMMPAFLDHHFVE